MEDKHIVTESVEKKEFHRASMVDSRKLLK